MQTFLNAKALPALTWIVACSIAIGGTRSTAEAAELVKHEHSKSTWQSRGKKGQRKVKLEPFIADFESAKRASRERNVPLLVHLVLEGEAENDTYRDTILPNKGLIEASHGAVVLIANLGEHKLKTVKSVIEGVSVEGQVCSAYPWFQNCAQHRVPWQSLYASLHEDDGNLPCPQTVIFSPAGKKVWRRADGNLVQASSILSALQGAQKEAGPGITGKDVSSIKIFKRDAERCTDGKLWGAAWRIWDGVLEITEFGAYADLARESLLAVGKEMTNEIDGILPGLVPGNAPKAYAQLYALHAEWHDTPGSKQVAKAMKSAEKKKDIADEIRAWRRAQEASELLNQAIAFGEQEDSKALRKVLRKLFSTKYAGTPAQAEALTTYPQYAPKKG